MKTKHSFRVVWTRTAEEDLEGIVDFIADDCVDAALAVFARIRERATTLVNFPGKGRVVPELHQHGIVQYRELMLRPAINQENLPALFQVGRELLSQAIKG
jgi:toxin ParE1/3/4